MTRRQPKTYPRLPWHDDKFYQNGIVVDKGFVAQYRVPVPCMAGLTWDVTSAGILIADGHARFAWDAKLACENAIRKFNTRTEESNGKDKGRDSKRGDQRRPV